MRNDEHPRDEEADERPYRLVKNNKVYESQLVRELLQNGEKLKDQDSQVLRGYLAFSKEEEAGEWFRLYPSLDLRNYIEFPKADILHIVQLDSKEEPLGVTVVWLKVTARIRRTSADSTESQADFLDGDISSLYLPQANTQALRNMLRALQRQLMAQASPGCNTPLGWDCRT